MKREVQGRLENSLCPDCVQLTEALTHKVSLCTKIKLKLNHTTGCLSRSSEHHGDMTNDLWTATPKCRKQDLEKTWEGSGDTKREIDGGGKKEKEKQCSEVKVRAGRQAVWSINVESNGLTEWGMMGKWLSCRVTLEVMYGSEDRARRSMADFSFPSSSHA